MIDVVMEWENGIMRYEGSWDDNNMNGNGIISDNPNYYLIADLIDYQQ